MGQNLLQKLEADVRESKNAIRVVKQLLANAAQAGDKGLVKTYKADLKKEEATFKAAEKALKVELKRNKL